MPEQAPPQPLTPEQVGAAAARQQAVAHAQEIQAARLDALDIQDPSQRAAPAPTTPLPEKQPEPKPQETPPVDPYAARFSQLEQSIASLTQALQSHSSSASAPPPSHEPEGESLPFEYPTGDDGVFTEQGAQWFKQQNEYWAARDKARAQELAELKKSFEQQQQILQQQAEQRNMAEFQKAHAETPEEYKPYVGSNFDKPTPEQQVVMQQIADEIDLHMARNHQLGRANPPMSAMYNRALKIVLGDKVTQTATPKLVEQARDAQGRFLAPPTSVERNGNSKPRNLTAEQRDENAVSAVAQLLAQRGKY